MNKEIYFCIDPFAYAKAKKDAGSWQEVESEFYSLTTQLIKEGCSPIVTTSMVHFSYRLIEEGYDVFLCHKDTRVKIEKGMKLSSGRALDGNPDEIYDHHKLLYFFNTGEFNEYFGIKEDSMEHVNHPKHYNSNPNGIECIDIIRHYTCDIANAIKYLWRAGLKPEMGMLNAEKEIEDLKKALWYIDDYRTLCRNKGCQHRQLGCAATVVLLKLTGHNIGDVAKGYEKNVAAAIIGLLRVGIISEHTVYAVEDWEYWLDEATAAIQQRIADLER